MSRRAGGKKGRGHMHLPQRMGSAPVLRGEKQSGAIWCSSNQPLVIKRSISNASTLAWKANTGCETTFRGKSRNVYYVFKCHSLYFLRNALLELFINRFQFSVCLVFGLLMNYMAQFFLNGFYDIFKYSIVHFYLVYYIVRFLSHFFIPFIV